MGLELYRTQDEYGARSNIASGANLHSRSPNKGVPQVTTIAKVVSVEYITKSDGEYGDVDKRYGGFPDVSEEKNTDASSIASNIVPDEKWGSDSVPRVEGARRWVKHRHPGN
ncbi:hypothetical protein PQX77_007610, partial [Marasmius sp. AFHP31]